MPLIALLDPTTDTEVTRLDTAPLDALIAKELGSAISLSDALPQVALSPDWVPESLAILSTSLKLRLQEKKSDGPEQLVERKESALTASERSLLHMVSHRIFTRDDESYVEFSEHPTLVDPHREEALALLGEVEAFCHQAGSRPLILRNFAHELPVASPPSGEPEPEPTPEVPPTES